jgi:amicoumacin kinase
MEKGIKERYSDEIRDETLRRYGVSHEDAVLLDGFESYIYEFSNREVNTILRVGHSQRRSPALIAGEVDWINYLVDGGVSASRALPSRSGQLIEEIKDGCGGNFLATAFHKADGRHVESGSWNTALMERYGHEIGKMHALSKQYRPLKSAWTRPQWDDPEMLDIQAWLPVNERRILMKFQELKRLLDGLPKNRDSYGLVHQDAHAGNLYVDDSGKITFFDFDDCAYSWYVNDIAIVLFYLLLGQEQPASFAFEFMSNFLRGYRQEMKLNAFWLGQIPNFLKLREIDLYAVIHRSFDLEQLDDPWVEMYMDGRKKKIEDDIPYVEFDFSSLIE